MKIIAVSWNEYEKSGCVSCGCEYCYGTGMSGGGSTPVKCGECETVFVILAEGVTTSRIGFGVYYPKIQEHPRKDIEKHAYIRPDVRPEGEGEFWSPRGIGVGRFGKDLSGFVKSREAGERIVKMFKDIVGEHAKTYLDYRPHEPTWIQVKTQDCDVDLEILHELTQDDEIITYDKIKQSKRD